LRRTIGVLPWWRVGEGVAGGVFIFVVEDEINLGVLNECKWQEVNRIPHDMVKIKKRNMFPSNKVWGKLLYKRAHAPETDSKPDICLSFIEHSGCLHLI
jgi:hypothetical protein